MPERRWAQYCLALSLAASTLLLLQAHGQGKANRSGSKTRTYYVAADEVNCNYAPAGRDEAMGMPFDDISKLYTQPGPHRIGSVYKKAVYRESTDSSFSTLKLRPPQEQYLGLLGPILRGGGRYHPRRLQEQRFSSIRHASARSFLPEGLRKRGLQR